MNRLDKTVIIIIMHHYIKNGKPFDSPDPIYYFEWIVQNGTVSFGFHGTESEYNEHCEMHKCYGERILRQKILVKECNSDYKYVD